MLKLDNNLLEELGLGGLPEDQKRQMLQHIYETLELRVGTQLANQMTDKQLEEFERFIDAGGDANQAQALQWLESNLPNYKQVVQETFDALKVEVKQMAPQLLAAAAQQSAASAPQVADPNAGYQTPPAQQYQASTPAPQPIQPPVQPMQPQSYAQPQTVPQTPQSAVPPTPAQFMPSQQPADNQSWQQPAQSQPVAPQPFQQPVPAPSLTQPQPPAPVPPAPQFVQQPTQDATAQPWQPQPTQPPATNQQAWQPPQPPVDLGQQPPQAA